MALVGLVAAAGFVVVAQRRQRQLGLLSAIGASARHLRLVMIVNGAIVGTVAAIGGAMLGVIGWIAAAPWVEAAANHRIDRFALPWALMATTLLIAVVMATAAAWWPARAVSRLSVMAALSGRPSRSAAGAPFARPRLRARRLRRRRDRRRETDQRPRSPARAHRRLARGRRRRRVRVTCRGPRAGGAGPPAALRPSPRTSRPGALPGPGGRRARGDHPRSGHLGRGRRNRRGKRVPQRRGQPLGPTAADPVRRPRRSVDPRTDRVGAERARRPSGDGRGRNRQRRGGPSARLRDEPGDVDGSERARTHHGRRPG